MLDVALSRRICCSRVCNAKRNAGLPVASMLCPTKRPGIERSNPVRTAKNPACGPPKPIGTPKRCAVPTAISAPHSPGALSSVKAKRSVAAITSASRECA